MRRFCTVLICFACIDLCNAFATDGSPLPMITDDQSRHEPETIDVGGPLFDYPISRALGIDVPAMLRRVSQSPASTIWPPLQTARHPSSYRNRCEELLGPLSVI